METFNNKYTKPTLAKILSKEKHKGVRLLDIGSGFGNITSFLAQLGFEVIGIDISEKRINVARKSYPNLKFICKDIYNLEIDEIGGKFDIITATEVIEHVKGVVGFTNKIKSLLKPGGLLAISAPYHGYIKNLLIILMGKFDEHFSPFSDHSSFFSIKTMSTLLKNIGFENIKFYFAGRVPPLYKIMIASCVAPRKKNYD